ncbi:hypothetical protein BDV19DRAFT_385519 [Aspergillus venezuelensis]
MFGTLRLDTERKNAEFIAQADGKAFSQMGCSLPPHSACDKCRAKKLKCSGQKTGCSRCKASRIKCTYSLISDAVAKRRRHAARNKAQGKSVDSSGSLGETSRPQTSFITAGGSVQIPDAASTQPAKADASTAYDAFQPSELPILDDINFHDLLPVHEEENFSMNPLCLPSFELPDFGLVEGDDGRFHMSCAPGSAEQLSNVWKLGNDERAAHTMFVGDYEIDDSDEWFCIIRGLLVVQLQRLRLLILEIEVIAMKEAMNTQVTMLGYAKHQVVQLVEGLRH